MNDKTENGKFFRKVGGYYWANIVSNPNYQIYFNYKKKHGEKIIFNVI